MLKLLENHETLTVHCVHAHKLSADEFRNAIKNLLSELVQTINYTVLPDSSGAAVIKDSSPRARATLPTSKLQLNSQFKFFRGADTSGSRVNSALY